MVIGEHEYNSRQGRVHIYKYDGSTWGVIKVVDGPNGDGDRDYGEKVSIDGTEVTKFMGIFSIDDLSIAISLAL